MKKVFMAIYYFFGWLLYVAITTKDRHRYRMGKLKGMHCIDFKQDGYIIKSAATLYTYDKNKEPEREYITWAEFWESRDHWH